MITSAHNPKIQRLRALVARRQEREAQGVIVVEGVRLVEEALAAGWQAETVFHSETLSPRGKALLDPFAQQGAEVEEVQPRLLESSADTGTPQGILAVLKRQPVPLPPAPDFVLIADALRDPGNLGTLLRSASAAGTQAVLLAPGTTDPFSPKTLRAGMGAQFRLPVAELDWEAIRGYCQNRPGLPSLNIFIAEAEQGTPCWQLDLRRPTALIVGGEADGVGQAALDLAGGLITIPMPGSSESLNAAVAAGILLFEVVRQRSQTDR